MLCAPRRVVIGLPDEEANAEGTCGTLVTEVKSIQYNGGKDSRERSSGRCEDNILILPKQDVSGLGSSDCREK
jgi:hypothetical protein